MSYSFRIEQAIRAASVLHKDQVRRGATPFPYVTHLYAVGMLVADYTDDEDTIVAALLHDTLEDTDYTFDELHDDFGAMVAETVKMITEPSTDDEDKKHWKEHKKQYVKQLKEAGESALIVAAAEKIHNMRCIVEEYYEKPSQFLADFGTALDERLMMYQEISNILNRKLKNAILAEFNHVFTEYKNFIEHVEQETSL